MVVYHLADCLCYFFKLFLLALSKVFVLTNV